MSKEWDKENMKTLACRVRTEEAEAFRQYAESLGTTTHKLLSSYVRSAMKEDRVKLSSVIEENGRLSQELGRLSGELKMMKNIAKQYESRAIRAEELVRKYVLER